MAASASDVWAEAVFSKATAAGLTKVSVEATCEFLINSPSVGRRNLISASVTYKGSAEQENAFKAFLEVTEAEDLEFQPVGLGEGDDCPVFTLAATADGTNGHFYGQQMTPKSICWTFGPLGADRLRSQWPTTRKCWNTTQTGQAGLRFSQFPWTTTEKRLRNI